MTILAPEAPRSRRLAWLVPALMVLAILSSAVQPVRSYDLGWQLASGRLIVEQKSIPSTDPFSFTRPGTPWLDHEWLFQLVCFLLIRLGGWPALLALVLLLVLATGALLMGWMGSERVGEGAAAILLALSLSGARFRFDARPEMASLCFMLVLFTLLQRSRRSPGGRWAWLLPPLFLLWGNVHPGAVLGAALLFLWILGEWGEGLLKGEGFSGGAGRAALCLLSPLTLLANPGGWRLFQVPFEIRRIVLSGHAPNLEWARPGPGEFPLFYLTLAAAVVVITLGFRRIDLPPLLVTAVAAGLALEHLRNVGLFFLLMPLALARPLASLEERVAFPRGTARVLSAALLALLAVHFIRGGREVWNGGYLGGVEPRKAVDFLESRGIGRRLFNDVLFGGYLIWRRFPDHKVFIDGRNEVYDSLLAEIFDAVNSGEKWKRLLDRYRIDAALLRRGQMQAVRYPPLSPGGAAQTELRAFSASHFPTSQWALVYWDDQALLFVRRDDPAAAPLLPGEYRIHPDDLPHTLLLLARGEMDRESLLREIDRKLREDPGCRSARRLRALIFSGPQSPRTIP